MINSQSMDIVKLENTAVMLSYYLYLKKIELRIIKTVSLPEYIYWPIRSQESRK